MPLFTYKATDQSGNLVEGTMEAPSETVLVNRLRQARLFPVLVETPREGRPQNGLASLSLTDFFSPGGTKKDLLHFTQQLSTLLNAGLNLDNSLSVIIDLCEREKFRKTVEEIQKTVHAGTSFTDAISRYPKTFSSLYISMVKAGEEGGVLKIIVERLCGFIENSEKLKDSVRSAMIYPLLLAVVGGGAVVVLMTYVIPKFGKIFSDMGQAIPLPTMMLLNISDFLISYWWLFPLLFLILGGLLKRYSETEKGKLFTGHILLNLPLVGKIQAMIQVARFSRTLGTLMKSGVPLLKAISITGQTLTNAVLQKSIDGLHKGVKEGGGISEPLKRSNLFPPLAVHMIRVGEETGKLEDMLMKVSDTYEREIENAVKTFISLLEPLMILFMGLVVGFIVISMLMAIFSMNDIPI
ncbi:MAG: type II secretion system inner membrane protein GspF [Nitrospinota bacterium]